MSSLGNTQLGKQYDLKKKEQWTVSEKQIRQNKVDKFANPHWKQRQ